jgi:hypothetical protein
MGWWMVVYWIATLILSEVLRPKVNIQDAKAASADEANMPTASSVKPIPVVWGKCRLRDPNVTWYGDYFTIPIKKRAGKGGFLGTGRTQWQTVAYRYYWGQQLALCHGPVTLHKIWAEERLVWTGTNTGGGLTIDDEGLYGGEDGGGGLSALLNFLPGNNTQIKDPYLVARLTDVPAYRGVASLVWYGPSMNMSYASSFFGLPYTAQKQSGYIGTSPAPRPLTVEVSRYPQQLTPAEAVIGEDANPIEVIYECLTNDPNGPDGWGMGLGAAMVDTTSFVAAAHQCYTEGFGISFVWAEQTPIEDVIKEVCKTIDATCFRDFRTGMWTIKLMRGGYNVATLPTLDVSNIIEVTNYSQMGLDGTTNEIKVNYSDRTQGYKGMPAQAQDLANMRLQSEVVSSTMTFKMITVATLADRVANRELLAQSTALAKADLIVNRTGYAFAPGDLFVLSWAPLGITSMVVRVMKSAIGLPNANRVRLSVVQDIFQLGQSSFMVGGGSQWTDPIVSPVPATVQKVQELPYYFNNDQTKASYMVCVQRPNSGCVTFEVWEKLSTETDYTYRDTCLTYTPVGVLSGTYSTKPGVDATGFVIAGGSSDVAGMDGATPDEIRAGTNLGMFDNGEFFAFEGITNNLDGTISLTNVWGGLFDTVPSSHAAGEKVWFFSFGASNPEDKVAQDAQINVKNLPYGPRGAIALAAATAANATMAAKNTKPYPPGRMQVNGLTAPASIIGLCQPTWAFRNRLTQTTVVKQDDASDATSEGAYNAKIYVNGVEKRSYLNLTSTELGTVAFGGPNAVYGICIRSNGDFFLTSSYAVLGSTYGAGPHCVFKVASGGFTLYHGSLTEVGLVNGSAGVSRWHWPTQMCVDSSNNIYVVDNLDYVRRIPLGGTSETFADLTSYDNIGSVTADGSDNIYVFASSQRCIVKITQARAVSVLAGNRYFDPNVETDGTGTAASFRYSCLIASDASGNIFVLDTPGDGGGTAIRYCTSAGVVTTIAPGGVGHYPGTQIACVGSDVYFGDSLSSVVHKCTPAGAVTSWTTHPDGLIFYRLQKDPSAGGFLIYQAFSSSVSEYGKIDSAGVITPIYRAVPQNGYSAAMRLQDSTNGAHLVEVKVQQTTGAATSAFNTTGPFQMSGFGMCFGQIFGGKQL